MTEHRELSDLTLSRKECPHCGAVWINGEHIWSGTGNKGSELDILGKVFDKLLSQLTTQQEHSKLNPTITQVQVHVCEQSHGCI